MPRLGRSAARGRPGLDAPAFELFAAELADTLRLLAGELYLSSKVRRYVLLRLDETLANDPGVTYDHKLITVEHVLPQNPKKGSQRLELFSGDERAFWTHRMANLVLLNRAKNSQAQNYDFDTKKNRYFSGSIETAPFVLTIQVLQQAEWTPNVLEARQKDLLQVLQAEWEL